MPEVEVYRCSYPSPHRSGKSTDHRVAKLSRLQLSCEFRQCLDQHLFANLWFRLERRDLSKPDRNFFDQPPFLAVDREHIRFCCTLGDGHQFGETFCFLCRTRLPFNFKTRHRRCGFKLAKVVIRRKAHDVNKVRPGRRRDPALRWRTPDRSLSGDWSMKTGSF